MKQSTRNVLLPVLMLIVAYEWLVSFVNKLVVPDYYKNLQQQMSQSISGIQFHPYANLMKNVGVPNVHLFGILVPLGEVFVGVSFVALAVQMFRTHHIRRGWAVLGLIASVVAAFMSLNYALMGGDTLFVNAANAFQEGISVDWLLFLIEVCFAFGFYSTVRHSRTRLEAEVEDNAA
ncbi:hypothetical protein NZD89_28275 (plasmid) [Alicyclobacillus fastidiosus]|uniref:Uncharacterized protein n=1 Tax=Alicyclobacillus fastidiosus TaxID=392011 RepID=A0ABY6ZQS3_9BACL|nr:hypothetical protein [Alicyclobacillus fastidiosus]WAH44943.1 hypothetical protein NZD89_28275 [Alicyclobacillus fastidiosus]GMA65596.1 hypothetical protein GCM10025859_60360 [Alicyclobacillus fastidiosus]GMA65712.1 hypothetical protein GCM10025859_61520 [Alicyclobacillus fastidiosus]